MQITFLADGMIQLGSTQTTLAWHPTPIPQIYDTPIARPNLVAHISTVLEMNHQVTLVGMPGSGKSTLATLVAQYSQTNYPSGVVYEHIGEVYDADAARFTLGEWLLKAIDLPQIPPDITPEPQIVQALWHQHPAMLVILDDVYSAPQIDNLRAALPAHARLIVTTRHRDVATQLSNATILIPALDDDEALQLLALRLVYPREALIDWEWPQELCAITENHPLLITIIAKFLRNQSNQPHVWETLFTQLIADLRNAGATHLLADTAIQKELLPLLYPSYQQLNPIEKQILHSLFYCAPQVGITDTFLGQLWDIPVTLSHATLQRLTQLGFVEQLQPNTWSQHTVMRTYVELMINNSDSDVPLRERMIHTVINMLHVAHYDYQFTQLSALIPHIRYAFKLALEHHLPLAINLVVASSWFHHAHGAHHEQSSWANAVLTHAIESGDIPLLAHCYALAADAAVQLGIHVGGQRQQYLTQGLEFYRQAQAYGDVDQNYPLTASVRNHLSICLQEMAELPDSDAPALYDEALAMLANAAQTPGLDAHLYVSICQNRANCYMGLANVHYPYGTEYLDSALAVCREGIRWLPQTHTTQHYASLYFTISIIHNAYSTHMDVNIQQQLEAALDANNNVLLHIGETEDKMKYAQVLMNRANIYSSLAELIDVDQRDCLQKSVDCLSESLQYRTVELVPLEYSWTQHNLALTLMQLSRLEGEHRLDRLTQAVAAANQALRFRTVHDVPEHHAMTQYFFALIYREIADANVDELADAHAACVAGINAIRAAKVYYQSHNAHIYAGTCDIEASLLARLARVQTGTQRQALQQEAHTLSEAAIDIYMGSNALEDAGEVYLNQAAIFWQQHLDNPHHSDYARQALQCALLADEFLAPSQRPQIVCASQITLGKLLFATSNPIDGLPQALPHVWQGYTLAIVLHDAPHIQQALQVLRQMQAQSDPATFARIWNQTIASPMPIWFTH